MITPRTSLTLTWSSVALIVGLSLWGYAIDSERPFRWLGIALFLPALWGYVEYAQYRGESSRKANAIMTWHRLVFAAMGFLFAMPLSVQLAIGTGLLDSRWESLTQPVMGILVGIGMAIWGNFIPKLLSPWKVDQAPFDWQRVHRFAGWVASIGGIAIVIAWLSLPVQDAEIATRAFLGTVCLLMVGRKILSVIAHSLRKPPVAG